MHIARRLPGRRSSPDDIRISPAARDRHDAPTISLGSSILLTSLAITQDAELARSTLINPVRDLQSRTGAGSRARRPRTCRERREKKIVRTKKKNRSNRCNFYRSNMRRGTMREDA
jgi:hypothetical protein